MGSRAILAGVVLLLAAQARAAAPVDYLKQVKPVLAARCYQCHGALREKSGLRLDTAAAVQKGGDSGPAIAPGKSAESLIVERITAPEGERMPPEGEPLSAEQIALVKAWIDQGAHAPVDELPQQDPRNHWAFRAVVRPPVPTVRNAGWVRNPIDAFVAAEHEKRGLAPRPAADKQVLLRRVFFDLIGLPPTRDEQRAFEADSSPRAYENVVDKLLVSPRYGERWARHWMDAWRYSDWYGSRAINELRNSRRNIWRWRDWIVGSLNADKGYDRMLLEMVAGDELAPSDPDVVAATGFLSRNYYGLNRNLWMQDTVEYTVASLCGITFKCCRCHDHKYDPIAQKEYYRLRALFEPYDVRTERIPGKPAQIDEIRVIDTLKAYKEGLERVYDADVEQPTYVLERGDDRKPHLDERMEPGLPAVLSGGGKLELHPVELPLEVYYPDFRPFVEHEVVAEIRDKLNRVTADLRKLHDQLLLAQIAASQSAPKPSAQKPQAPAKSPDILKYEAAIALAEKKRDTTEADLDSLQARYAAERARYATPPDPEAPELAVTAGAAERRAKVRKAEEDLLLADQQLATAQKAIKPGNQKSATDAAAAEAVRTAAYERMVDAKVTAVRATNHYSPLGPIYPSTSSGRRLAFAHWLVDRKNPLVARVAVNQIWLHNLGSAIVSTVNNFGLSGKPPVNQPLLDWMAAEMMDHGWHLKHLQRLIVTSNTYCMQSTDAGPDDPNLQADADNVYLWRANPRRMEAEVVRDSLLYLTGQVDTTLGGPELDPETASTTRRWSIYYAHAPEYKAAMLDTFDSADPLECARRQESVAPQQALALLNSVESQRQARLVARNLSNEIGSETASVSEERYVRMAFQQVLSRPASLEEVRASLEFLAQQEALLERAGTLNLFEGSLAGESHPAADPRQRARENLIHGLFNSNEFVTIR